MNGTVVVLAKAPVPGRVKTRLCPPCRPEDAAVLAAALLLDTLSVVSAVRCARRVVAFDGAPGRWVSAGFDVIAQPCGRLDERLASAFVAVDGPTVLVGMDTPQMTAATIERALAALQSDADAVLGPALDGGFWLLGLADPDPRAVLGVPMSVETTGAVQRARLESLGLRIAAAPTMRDVDRYADAIAVARLAPRSRFAAALRDMGDVGGPRP